MNDYVVVVQTKYIVSGPDETTAKVACYCVAAGAKKRGPISIEGCEVIPVISQEVSCTEA